MAEKLAGASLKRAGASDEERSAAARAMGSARTEAKAAASRENGKKAPPGPGRPLRPINEIPCTCGKPDVIDGHPTTCPRGQAIKRRQKAGTLTL